MIQTRIRNLHGDITNEQSFGLGAPSASVEIEGRRRRGIIVRIWDGGDGISITAVDHVNQRIVKLYEGRLHELFNRETGPMVALFQHLAEKIV